MALCYLALSASARAQQASGIAGVVRDTSGLAMPGVTVEAASPALIERVRNVVTDGEGVYKIVDLRPGTYSVTFTLPGFNTFKRDGIELSASWRHADWLNLEANYTWLDASEPNNFTSNPRPRKKKPSRREPKLHRA
jgi:hypothetical protein